MPIRDGLNPTRARVPDGHAPVSAGEFLRTLISTQRHRHPADDADALRARFDDGEVVLRDGTPLRPDSLVPAGQDVWFYRMPAPETPVPYEIKIIEEDDALLVVDKPPFLATMPRARHITETATVRLRRATGNNDLVPAHRLDRQTSGVLVFTKRREVRGAYQSLFAERKVEKVYEAIADHDPALAEAAPLRWASRLHKVHGEIQGSIVAGEANAFTVLDDVTPLSESEQAKIEAVHGPRPRQARYRLRPETGRTHQLRLHMWAAGVPILGDGIYPVIHPAEDEDLGVPLHLISRELAFVDPLSGVRRTFTALRRQAWG